MEDAEKRFRVHNYLKFKPNLMTKRHPNYFIKDLLAPELLYRIRTYE